MLQQLVALAFEHLDDRDAGPARDDFGDFLGGDLVLQQLEVLASRLPARLRAAFPVRAIVPYWISLIFA